jgi:CRISPR-associated protein Cas5d
MVVRSPPLSLRARGALAVFTQPTLKVERFSYPVMTPSAARGILESVLWKPAIVWLVERIRVLRPIRFVAFRRNEVNSKAPTPSTSVINNGGVAPFLLADDDRAQRNTVALRDVDYVIEARFALTERAGPGDNVAKFVDMFTRRIDRGQHFQQPYLGCREFVADVQSAADAPAPIAENRSLGFMLWDVLYQSSGNRAVYFEAELKQGVLEVPAEPPQLAALRAQGAA